MNYHGDAVHSIVYVRNHGDAVADRLLPGVPLLGVDDVFAKSHQIVMATRQFLRQRLGSVLLVDRVSFQYFHLKSILL